MYSSQLLITFLLIDFCFFARNALVCNLCDGPAGFFDPLGISDSWDAATFERYQLGEVKNGRVAMLAVLGYVVPEVVRLPGDLAPGVAFKDIPNGLHAFDVIPGLFWPILMFFIGSIDYLNSNSQGRLETLPGDMDDETMKQRRTNELSNGRLAMLAFWELVRHDLTKGADEPLITGLPFLYN
jgi:light-harvesting complex I chlorophyll a/b binding protein 1